MENFNPSRNVNVNINVNINVNVNVNVTVNVSVNVTGNVTVNVTVNTGWLGENWTSMAAPADEHFNRFKPHFLYLDPRKYKIDKLVRVICISDSDDKFRTQVIWEEFWQGFIFEEYL